MTSPHGQRTLKISLLVASLPPVDGSLLQGRPHPALWSQQSPPRPGPGWRPSATLGTLGASRSCSPGWLPGQGGSRPTQALATLVSGHCGPSTALHSRSWPLRGGSALRFLRGQFWRPGPKSSLNGNPGQVGAFPVPKALASARPDVGSAWFHSWNPTLEAL